MGNGTYECFHCGERAVVWGGDFDYDDYCLDGDGMVHELHCTECGARIRYLVDDARPVQRVRCERTWAMPSGNTFTIPPIQRLVERAVRDAGDGAVIVDPFANTAPYGTITNDLNPNMPTTHHMDALQFLRTCLTEEADLVLYDPPYSHTQAKRLYDSYGADKLDVHPTNMAYWARCKDEIARILKPGGVVLCFGWNTNGVGKCRGMRMTDVLIVHHGGSKNDTLCTREVKEG